MAQITYNTIPVGLTGVGYEDISAEDKALAQSLLLNSSFDETTHRIEFHIYGLGGSLLYSENNFRGAQQLLNSVNGSNLYLDPQQDIIDVGYANGEVRIIYNFLSDYSTQEFFISKISEDRTELLIVPVNSTVDITSITAAILEEIQQTPYFPEFRLNFGNNELLIGVNISTVDNQTIAIKLYEPLPAQFKLKQKLTLTKRVSDSVAFEIGTEFTPDVITYPALRSPNFNIDVQEANLQPTEYLNYNSLYNYPVTNNYHQVITVLSQSGAEISIDYTDYSNFIHFSSAEERLKNFKHKMDLLEEYSYSASISTNYQPHYDTLTENIIAKFDGYEKYLYFESGSKAWPKTTTLQPYINDTVTNSTSWYTSELASASLYDELNDSRLTYTTPAFIREDATNAPYELFLDMIGQHFDNVWVYAKAVTDKYNADNRLDYGVSKDLVADTLKSFGVKLYSSNFGVSSLAANLLGEFYNTGSEQITTFITASNDPTPDKDLLQETYKRIYHNLPYLIKTKGTERGLRALINTFGIPSGSLEIMTFGGVSRPGDTPYFASAYPTGSKIRLNNTGSLAPGGTLSQYTSIQKDPELFTQDRHVVEAGFSPTYNMDEYIKDNIDSAFNIDEYIGDPNLMYQSEYINLDKVSENLLQGVDVYDVFDYVRLIKFFDNQLFKMVRDFLPARDVVSSGIIIKPHILDRSKVKSPALEMTRPEYSASIDTAFVTGSAAGVLNDFSTAYTASIPTPFGAQEKIHNTEVETINGELGGTVLDLYLGSLNELNQFKQFDAQEITYSLVEYLENDSPTFTEADFLALPVTMGKMYTFRAYNSKSGYHFLKYIYFRNTSYNSIDVKESVRVLEEIYVNGVKYVPVDRNITNSTTLLTIADPGGGYFANPSLYPTTDTVVDVIFTPFFRARFDNSDYNATFNNALQIANRDGVQRVDYSVNPLVPVNLAAILDNTAERADMQEYVHNSAGFVRGRYTGQQLNGAAINIYTEGDVSYGTTPVIESTTPFFCVFDYISGFSPEHNKANAVVISYIVDEEGNLYTPDSPQALHLLKQGFKANTNLEVSIKDANIGGSEATLLGTQQVLRGGARLEPLAYSYTATTYLQPSFATTDFLEFDAPSPQPTTYDLAAYGIPTQTLGATVGITTSLTFPSETKDDKNYFVSPTYTLQEDTEQKIKLTFTGTFHATGYLQPGGYYTSGAATIKILHCTDSTFAANKTTILAAQSITYNDYVDQEVNLVTAFNLYNSGSAFRVVAEVNSTFDEFTVASKYLNVVSEFSGSAYLPVSASFTTGSASKNVLTASLDLSSKYGSYFKGISGSAADGFNNPNLTFEPQVGDEIKFNNEEARTYLVTSVETPAQNQAGQLYITLNANTKTSDNINFFALRRYVDASNMILLKADKVAGTQSNGILYPLYPSSRLDKNYEKIISDLKTKGIL